MSSRRISIASLMWVVGIAALNLALGRVIFAWEPWRLAGVGLIGVTIQLGLFFLIRARGRPRLYAFWAGFTGGCTLGLCSFLYARVPDSRVGAFWDEYAAFIDGFLAVQFGIRILNRSPFDPVLLVIVAVFGFLPQILMGCAGGLVGLAVAWWRGRNDAPDPAAQDHFATVGRDQTAT